MSDLISVIIPVYNVKDYLQACIDSVRSQTYTNLEIILVDDGSTDESGAMCDRYATEDGRVRVIHKTNGGQSSARNMGIDAASGKWLTFVDSDDLIAPDMVESLFTAIGDCDIVMCDRQKFTDVFTMEEKNGEAVQYSNLEFLNKIYEAPKFIAIWGKLYKCELFREFRFREGIIYEDEDALPQLIYAARRITHLQEEKYYYRVRPGSTMHSTFSKKQLDVIGVCEHRIELFSRWGLEQLRRQAVKDYYSHLKRLKRQTKQQGMAVEHALVTQKLREWKDYGVRLSLPEILRQAVAHL